MNPFNPLSIVQSTFESDDVQHELKELVEIIRAYDIYDFLRRLSALNLQKENQNRAVLLDALQSAILYNDETYYTSSAKMSAGKFSSIIKKMDSISLVHAIDPNENVFTQNVMLYDNYTVFNGIDSYPAYRLQMFCEIFFGFKNSFPLEYIKKVYFLFSAMLKISTCIAKSIGISSEPPIIEAASTKVPSNETLTYHSKLISISRNNMLRMLNNDLDMLDIIAIQFGTHAWGSIDSKALDEAFLSAYSYSYTQLIVFIHLLVDFGEEHLQGEVVITTKNELLEYLYECDNEFSSEISTRILKDITLTAREDFMKAPAGFRKEDVYPWRFNRQYSFVRRPILCRGNDLIWGIRQLYHSLLYVTNLIYDGRLATTNKKMNTLMGRICNDQGDAFNQHIASQQHKKKRSLTK